MVSDEFTLEQLKKIYGVEIHVSESARFSFLQPRKM